MLLLRKILFYACLITFPFFSYGQKDNPSGLFTKLKTVGSDTALSNINNKIALYYSQNAKYDSAAYYANTALELGKKSKNLKNQSVALSTLGFICIREANYLKAINYHLKALLMMEELKDTAGISKVCNNLGLSYSHTNDDKTSMQYYRRSLALKLKMNEQKSLGSLYSNMGSLFGKLRAYDSAIFYFNIAIKIAVVQNNLQQQALNYGNLAATYGELQNKEKALEAFKKAIPIQEKTGDYKALSHSYCGIGTVYTFLNDFKNAELYLNKGYDLSVKLNSHDQVMQCVKCLAMMYHKKGDFKKAYEYRGKELLYKDTILSESSNDAIHKLQANFDFEKKQKEVELGKSLLKARDAEIKTGKIIKYSLVIGLMAFVLFSGFLYNRFTVTRKQKNIIETQKQVVEEQKNLVEETKKEIIDSINYAQRLQQAILPSSHVIKEYLPESFIYYKPKDIVAGDFYWLTCPVKSNTDFYLAVCDSTGHGVPGAFMSIVNVSFLNEAINQKDIYATDKILNYVRSRLIESISHDGQQDGMDGALLHFNKKTNIINYSSANTLPVIISNGKIIETFTDKMPIGKGERTEAFKLYSVQANPGDMIYLYTDGYPDQFGGPKGKKFKRSHLNELLISISHLSLDEQEKIIDQKFSDWKNTVQQVDDVTVVGIKI